MMGRIMRWALVTAVLYACAGPPAIDEVIAPPVVATFEGTFDGRVLTLRPRGDESRPDVDVAALADITLRMTSAGGSRTVRGAPGCADGMGSASDVAIENDGTSQYERVYLELLSVTPTGSTTSVGVRPSATSAVPDFGLGPAVHDGLLRVGEIGRHSTLVVPFFTFVGCTSSSPLTFTFLVQMRGIAVAPTHRASLPAGVADDPSADYPVRAAGSSVPSSSVSMSDDGSVVAFATTSSALLDGAGGQHVVVRDELTGSISVASVRPTGIASSSCRASDPHLSADGSLVVFTSSGCTLLPALGPVPPNAQVYLRDLTTGTTTLVSVSTSGGYANGSSSSPRVSADGSTIVFESRATDLVAGASARSVVCGEIYRRSLGTTSHVSAVRGGGFASPCDPLRPPGRAPDVNGDGSRIVFTSGAPLDPSGDLDALDDVYVRDVGAGTIFRASVGETGDALTGGTGAGWASISRDGAWLAFVSDHTNVVGASAPRVRHVYRRPALEGEHASIARVTTTPLELDASTPELATIWPALSPTGRFVAFWSRKTELAGVPGRFSAAGAQLYACDMGSPAPALARCFVASTAQLGSGAPFVSFTGPTGSGSRIALAYPDEGEAGYVAYQALPRSWPRLEAASFQVFVSPIGDPRAQMPLLAP